MVHDFSDPVTICWWNRDFPFKQHQSPGQERTEGQHADFPPTERSAHQGHTKQCNEWRRLHCFFKYLREGLNDRLPWTCPKHVQQSGWSLPALITYGIYSVLAKIRCRQWTIFNWITAYPRRVEEEKIPCIIFCQVSSEIGSFNSVSHLVIKRSKGVKLCVLSSS